MFWRLTSVLAVCRGRRVRPSDSPQDAGKTPLHWAALVKPHPPSMAANAHHPEVVLKLLEAGAEIDVEVSAAIRPLPRLALRRP